MSTPDGARPRIQWRTQIAGIRNAVLPPSTTRPNPLVTTDKVLASLLAPGAICALERRTGKILWVRELGAYASSAAYIHRNSLYATSCRTLYSLDPDTGNIKWEFSPKPEEGEWVYSQPVVKGNCVFIGDRLGHLHCLEARTGKPIWRRQLSRGCNNQVNCTPLIAGETVIAANNQGAVVSYAAATGKTLWRQRIDGGCTSELLRLGKKVVVAGVSLYEIDSQTGQVQKRYTYPKKRVASVSIAGRSIVAILGIDFAAWEEASSLDSELVVIESGREGVRRQLSGSAYIRTCDVTGLIFIAGPTQMCVFDPSDGSFLSSRDGGYALPCYSEGVLYGLTEKGVLFAESVDLRR